MILSENAWFVYERACCRQKETKSFQVWQSQSKYHGGLCFDNEMVLKLTERQVYDAFVELVDIGLAKQYAHLDFKLMTPTEIAHKKLTELTEATKLQSSRDKWGTYCKNCGKVFEKHSAIARACPIKGSKGPFIQYSRSSVFDLDTNKKPKKPKQEFVL